MSGRGKYKSMGVSYREGQDGGGRGSGGGGRGRGRGNRYRKTLNGNYIKQGGEEANEDSTRPQVSEQQRCATIIIWSLFCSSCSSSGAGMLAPCMGWQGTCKPLTCAAAAACTAQQLAPQFKRSSSSSSSYKAATATTPCSGINGTAANQLLSHPLCVPPSPDPAQLLEQRQADQLESVLGWPLFTEGEDRLGWLMNFTTVGAAHSSRGAWVQHHKAGALADQHLCHTTVFLVPVLQRTSAKQLMTAAVRSFLLFVVCRPLLRTRRPAKSSAPLTATSSARYTHTLDSYPAAVGLAPSPCATVCSHVPPGRGQQQGDGDLMVPTVQASLCALPACVPAGRLHVQGAGDPRTLLLPADQGELWRRQQWQLTQTAAVDISCVWGSPG